MKNPMKAIKTFFFGSEESATVASVGCTEELNRVLATREFDQFNGKMKGFLELYGVESAGLALKTHMLHKNIKLEESEEEVLSKELEVGETFPLVFSFNERTAKKKAKLVAEQYGTQTLLSVISANKEEWKTQLPLIMDALEVAQYKIGGMFSVKMAEVRQLVGNKATEPLLFVEHFAEMRFEEDKQQKISSKQEEITRTRKKIVEVSVHLQTQTTLSTEEVDLLQEGVKQLSEKVLKMSAELADIQALEYKKIAEDSGSDNEAKKDFHEIMGILEGEDIQFPKPVKPEPQEEEEEEEETTSSQHEDEDEDEDEQSSNAS